MLALVIRYITNKMNINDIKKIVENKEYDFLRTNPHLGNNIILLGLGGSYAYGTNVESSDIDLRGIALNTKEDILTYYDFEQVVSNETDTTIYSFNKVIHLFKKCNPNVIEMLGLKPEHYIHLSAVGEKIINNYEMFLSKQAIYSFGGYANDQFNRLQSMFIGERNAYAIKHNKLNKHMMHLIRLYMMCIDILKDHKIRTYRDNKDEHNLLMDIRNGKYIINNKPTAEFDTILKSFVQNFEYYKQCTTLPDKVDDNCIKKFIIEINENIIRG